MVRHVGCAPFSPILPTEPRPLMFDALAETETDVPSLEESVRIGDSAHGQGVFARRRFVPDEIIGEIKGKVIRGAGYGSPYCMDLGEDLTLEPAAPFRFLNHGCRPNCELVCFEDDENGVTDEGTSHPRMWLCAADGVVEAGEEMTIDYAWPADEAIPCGCGAAECRGWIVDPDELASLAGPPGGWLGSVWSTLRRRAGFRNGVR